MTKSKVRSAGLLIMLLVIQVAPLNAHSLVDSLVIRFANRTRIVIYAPDKAGIQALSNYDLNKIVREMGMKLDSVPGGQTAISQDGGQYLKDTVLVVTKRREGMTIIINDKGDTIQTRSRDDNATRDYKQARRQRSERTWKTYFNVSLGLNNFIQQNGLNTYSPDSYRLQPLGSRYFALSAAMAPTLIRGRTAGLQLYYGLELAWNNFMFEQNVVAEKTATGVAFVDPGQALQKSKLTVCTVGVPFVPRLTFYNGSGRRTFYIGAGGYVNYRLDSYRKIKGSDSGVDRRHSDYYLNNVRYGVMAQIGIRQVAIFAKYDLSPLFMDGKGPDVRTLTVGFGF